MRKHPRRPCTTWISCRSSEGTARRVADTPRVYTGLSPPSPGSVSSFARVPTRPTLLESRSYS
eukprot:3409868-Prymnesium_polylepis.1